MLQLTCRRAWDGARRKLTHAAPGPARRLRLLAQAPGDTYVVAVMFAGRESRMRLSMAYLDDLVAHCQVDEARAIGLWLEHCPGVGTAPAWPPRQEIPGEARRPPRPRPFRQVSEDRHLALGHLTTIPTAPLCE